MMSRFPIPSAFLSLSLLLLALLPVQAAERSPLLLYGFGSTTPATPEPVPGALALLVRDELQKGDRFAVSIRSAEAPVFRRAESEQPGADPTRLHQALRVARSLGARYVVQGMITAYEAPQASNAGQISFRITVASTETEVSRDVIVIEALKVAGKGPLAAAKVLGPAARAVARAISSEAIPALARATPEDRAQVAERARQRGQEAAAGGATGPAIAELRRAAKLTPEDAATHVALGEALVKQGLLASALLEFRQALALQEATGGPPADTPLSPSPSEPSTLNPQLSTNLRLRVIRALAERGYWDEAAAEARRGLEREPGSEALRLTIAEAALRAGNGAAALEALRAIHAARSPRDAEWRLLAEAHALVGDAPRWLEATVRGAVAGVPEEGQYAAVSRRLDQVFRLLADEAEEAERRMLAGQLSQASFAATATRRAAQTRLLHEYLGRLAFPESAAAAHAAREGAWAGLARAAERAARFGSGGTYDDLAAARGERLRAVAQMERAGAR